jgi:DNA repair exonuclease SbcCD ATPase subunit
MGLREVKISLMKQLNQ